MRYLIAIILTVSQTVFCGFEQTEWGARSRGLGGASPALANDSYSIYFNPAGLVLLKHADLSFSYTPQVFGFSELSHAGAVTTLPTGIGAFGLGIQRYGFELYREVSGTISYANTLGAVDIGLSLNYNSVAIKNYGSAAAVGIDLGILVQVLKELRLGASAKNINSPAIGDSKEKLPQTFSMGFCYSPANDLSLAVGILKEDRFESSERVGVEYRIINNVALRTGVSTEPSQYAAGFGLILSAFKLDYAFSTHHELGWTHEFSLTIQLGGSDE